MFNIIVVLALIGLLLGNFAVQRYNTRPPSNPLEPYAKIIADSVTEKGHRLTTMEVRFHRFVLAEFNTHSIFVRNSASSRAIPVKKMLALVRNSMAMPLKWPSEQSGMQGGNSLTGKQVKAAERRWRFMARVSADVAAVLSKIGVHKSITNRILEPFMWHTVVVTSSNWENFFDQRISPLAQAEIAEAAFLMREALESSTPQLLLEGQAHLPYVDEETIRAVEEDNPDLGVFGLWRILMRVSAARCARVSYLTQDGKKDYHKDLTLFTRLVSATPKHWSPLAHVAIPCEDNVQAHPLLAHDDYGQKMILKTSHLAKVGQFPGWISMRHIEETHGGVITAR